MGEITARKFRLQDWYLVKNLSEGFDESPNTELLSHCDGVTILDNKEVVGCGGLILFENYAELWIKISDRNYKFPYNMYVLDILINTFKVIRNCYKEIKIYSRVKTGFQKGIKLVKIIGMKHIKSVDGYEVYAWQDNQAAE